jgi:hypothetical protein
MVMLIRCMIALPTYEQNGTLTKSQLARQSKDVERNQPPNFVNKSTNHWTAPLSLAVASQRISSVAAAGAIAIIGKTRGEASNTTMMIPC